MAKTVNNPKEKMRMNIELADNGIIIRNPENEDEVTLALTGGGVNLNKGYGYEIDHSEEYKAIGKKIFDWLLDVVIQEHEGELVITNFDIDVVATRKGHEFR